MSLPATSSLASDISALTPSADLVAASTAFAAVVGNFVNQAQAGATSSPGVITFGNSAMAAVLETQAPVPDSSWTSGFASAWAAGISANPVNFSTIADSSWTGSAGFAISATISNLAAAQATLSTDLANVSATNNPPTPLADAIRNGTLALQFDCVGLGPPPTFTPIPITKSAQ